MFRVLTSALLFSITLVAGTAQAGAAESLAEVSRRLMTLSVESQRGDVVARDDAMKAQLSVAVAREQQLAALIADHPEVVLRHALPADMRASLPSTVQAHVEEELTSEGELEVLHEDGPNGSRYHYFMHRPAGRLTLHFAADAPVLQTGDRVRVSGVRVQQAMALGSGSSDVTVLAAALSNTFGAQKIAVILVNFQDKPTQTVATPAQVYDTMFATDGRKSVTAFYKEASYGQAWLDGDVYGLYTIPVNSTSCNTGSIASYAKQAATAEVGAAKMGTYNRFVYVFPFIGCGWGGLGTVGGNPSQAWINGSPDVGTISHEMGHNFGLWHSHALLCDGGHTSVCSSGSSIEYGDAFDTMGYGLGGPMHFNAVQKELLGWLNYGGSPPITTVQTSGTYTINPYETSGAEPKALKVKLPSGDWYYVEYRQALGFDASTLKYNPNVTDGVLVHLWSQQNPNGIYLLNMGTVTPDWTYPALDVGGTFSDPASGIAISSVWANGTAGVQVSVGGGGTACVRRSPTVKVTPAQQQGSAGTAVSYTVSVTNNDSGCAAASFTQQAAVPAGWAASFAASTLSIAAGATASTALQVTSSASAAVGTYTVSPKSSNTAAPTNSASATAMYDVANGATAGTFSDNFNRPDAPTLGNGWTPISGSLAIHGNRATNPPVRTVHAAVQAGLVGPTQNVAASFASGGNNSAPEFGLLTRYNDSNNYYTCYRHTGGTSVLRISKVVGGVETILRSVSVVNPATGVPFSLGCQVRGTMLTLTLNGSSKLTVSDSTFATGSVGMSMGYRGSGNSASSNLADDFLATVQ
jgi:hypothetical protein